MNRLATAAGSLPVMVVDFADAVNVNSTVTVPLWGGVRPNSGHRSLSSVLFGGNRGHFPLIWTFCL